MIRETIFLFILGLVAYFMLALYLPSDSFVGTFGATISDFLLTIFGNIVYVFPIVALFVLYRFYRSKHLITPKRSLEVTASILLFLFAGLIFQALIFDHGMLGLMLNESISPFVGNAGVAIFGFFLILNGWMLAFDITILMILKFLARKFPKAKLFENFQEFKEATKDSFSDMIATRNRAVLEDIPLERVVERASPASTSDQESYIRAKQEEIASVDEDEIYEIATDRIASETRSESSFGKPKAKLIKELEENKKLLDQMEKGKSEKPKDFKLPPLEFLTPAPPSKNEVNESEIDEKIADLLEKLKMFKIEGDVVRTYTGPVVTTFEFKPAPHIKVSRILNLEDDIAMALRAQTIRIQAPIPGKDVVGIEIPNASFDTIYLRDLIDSEIFKSAASPLTIALGKDIVGNPFITDLKKLPHLLIAGTTGSGKSVGINAMILSLLYRNSPDSLRMIMIDPKMLEFSIYNDIPHLLTPVITKPKQAIAALANTVKEMERRYAMMSKTKTKNIENYNQKAKQEGYDQLPFIVVIIDELADLMMTGGKDVEISIARLAQMARASGIHLVVATQRPSVDVITGLIKANLPSRASYRVGSKVDSKVILDTQGAEALLGRGDMLFTPPGSVGLVRLHAPFSTEKEIEKIADFLKEQREAEYDNSFIEEGEELSGGISEDRVLDEELDEFFEEAINIVRTEKKSSISYLQRRLQIGYNRAARIVEQLEKMGILSEQNSKGQREIL